MKKNKVNIKKIKSLINENIYIILAFVCASALMLLTYYIYDVIPFGQSTVLRMDLFHQYGPLFAELYDRLTDFKSLLYSWNTGGGGSFLGNYYNYLSSPIGGLVALLAGHENIPEAIGVMVLLKNALSASIFAYFIKKSFGKNDFSIAAFGLMYSFSAFFIAYYWNVMWIDAMYLLPLTVLGIENIINKRKCKLYAASLALAFFANYYMAYMICFFAVLYFLVYFISKNNFTDKYDELYHTYQDDNGEIYHRKVEKITANKFLRSGFLFALSSIVAVGLVAFAVIPTYMCLRSCSATSGSFPQDANFYNSVFDFLANHLNAFEPTIRSSGDRVLPNVFCGTLTVILIPLYLFCNKISFKEKAAHVCALAVFFVGFNLNYANYILHAFHFPNDLPYRFSFLYSFLLLVMGYKVLTHIRSFSGAQILGSGVAVTLFTVLVQKLDSSFAEDNAIYISIAFTVLFTFVLLISRKKSYSKQAVSLLLMCCVFAEVAVCETGKIEITQQKPNFTNGYEDFRTLKDTLDDEEGNDYYRMELTDINTLMDASWFNYNGLSVFSSMAYEASANMQNQLGMDSNYINSYVYHSQTPVYNAMMSLKYLVQNDDSPINEDLFERSSNVGKFTAFKNRYYLPIGFAVDGSMTDFEIAGDNPFTIQNNMWYYATGIDDVLTPISVSDYEVDNISPSDDFYSDGFSFSKITSDAEGEIQLKYVIPETQNVYVFFKNSDVDNIYVSTESGFEKHQNIDEPYILDCGVCLKDEVLTVKVPIAADKDTGYAECFVVGLDSDRFEAGYSILSANTLNVESFTETNIKGTIDMPAGKMLYTSINYDDGWTVKVDGIKMNKEKIGGALIGVYVPEGTHTIEFSYVPQGFTAGILITAGTVLLLAAYFIIINLKGKEKRAKAPKPVKPVKPSKSERKKLYDDDGN
ncbi:MAG: YfhO family protein, partial [Clostridia bacterium]|nr:YfhO family protein [Clostridia bacterium]